MSLVHHVCKETEGLESLFLISKSNCAFANFKDEATCAAAQQKLHDSKFQTVRLVSRLRKNAQEAAQGSTTTGGQPASIQSSPSPSVAEPSASMATADVAKTSQTSVSPATLKANPAPESGGSQDKFFILKSLTVEDLDLSVRTGIWATQSHNEEALNNAFKVSGNY